MRSLMPWSGMTGLKQDMDRVLDRFFESRWEELPALGDWMPKVDVSETKDSVVVKAETPGHGCPGHPGLAAGERAHDHR